MSDPASRPFHRLVGDRPELLEATQRIEELLWDDDALPAVVVERIRLASARALDCPF